MKIIGSRHDVASFASNPGDTRTACGSTRYPWATVNQIDPELTGLYAKLGSGLTVEETFYKKQGRFLETRVIMPEATVFAERQVLRTRRFGRLIFTLALTPSVPVDKFPGYVSPRLRLRLPCCLYVLRQKSLVQIAPANAEGNVAESFLFSHPSICRQTSSVKRSLIAPS